LYLIEDHISKKFPYAAALTLANVGFKWFPNISIGTSEMCVLVS